MGFWFMMRNFAAWLNHEPNTPPLHFSPLRRQVSPQVLCSRTIGCIITLWTMHSELAFHSEFYFPLSLPLCADGLALLQGEKLLTLEARLCTTLPVCVVKLFILLVEDCDHVVVACGLTTQLLLYLRSVWSQCMPDHRQRCIEMHFNARYKESWIDIIGIVGLMTLLHPNSWL